MDDDHELLNLPTAACDLSQDSTDDSSYDKGETIPEGFCTEEVNTLFQIIQNITEYDFNFDLALDYIVETFKDASFKLYHSKDSAKFIELLIHEEMFDDEHRLYLQFILQLSLFFLGHEVDNSFTELFMEHLYDMLTLHIAHFDLKCMLTFVGILHLLVEKEIEFEISSDLLCDIISNGDNTHKLAISSLLLSNPTISSIENMFNFLSDFLYEILETSNFPQQIIVNFTKSYINYFRILHKEAILYELLGHKLKKQLSIPSFIELLYEFDIIENFNYYINDIFIYLPHMTAIQTHRIIKIIIQYIITLSPETDISSYIYPITESKGMKFLVDLLNNYEFSKTIIIFFAIVISYDPGELILDLILHIRFIDVIMNTLETLDINDNYLIYIIGIISKILVTCLNYNRIGLLTYSLKELNNDILNISKTTQNELTKESCLSILKLVSLINEKI